MHTKRTASAATLSTICSDLMYTPEFSFAGSEKLPSEKKAEIDGCTFWFTNTRVVPFACTISYGVIAERPDPAGQYACTSYLPGNKATVGKNATRLATPSEVYSDSPNASVRSRTAHPALTTMLAPSIMREEPTAH
jgi:hypothetical protein